MVHIDHSAVCGVSAALCTQADGGPGEDVQRLLGHQSSVSGMGLIV